MAREIQPTFFDQDSRLQAHQPRREHGGAIRKSKRKLARPVDPRKPLHLTLRSESARGAWSMLRAANGTRIKNLVYRYAAKNGVKIIEFANSGNHLHFLIKVATKDGFKRFLRTVTGMVARLVTGAVKGKAQGKFWDELAYTRVVTWGREIFHVRFYVILNEIEAQGVWSRKWNQGRKKAQRSRPRGS